MITIGQMDGWRRRLPCWRKVRHGSLGKVRAAIRASGRRGATQRAGESLGGYRCWHCGFWHVGHFRKEGA